MSEALAFFVAGCGTGAVYGLLGLGIMALYRSTGVLNFAFGAIGAVAVFCYASLVDAGLAPALAVLVVVLGAAPAGALLELLVMRRLQDEDETSKAVATVAVLVGLIGVVNLVWGSELREIPRWLPDWSVEIGGTTLPPDRLGALLVVALVLLGLWLLFSRTRTGVALRAMASDRPTAALVGIPIGRLIPLAWALAAVLAALAVVLVAPSRGPDPAGLSLLVIPGLAAAVIGDLRSPAGIVAGGLALGIVEAEAGLTAWTSQNALAVPFVILLLVLLWRQRTVLIPAMSGGGMRA